MGHLLGLRSNGMMRLFALVMTLSEIGFHYQEISNKLSGIGM